MPSGRHHDFEILRSRYPFFEYRSYHLSREKNGLTIQFCFNLADRYLFRPTLHFHAHSAFVKTEPELLNIFAFHIGMVELISYWKTTCPSRLIIRPHSLSTEQQIFWRSLYWNGLGEFFYLNGIRSSENEFLIFEANEGHPFDLTQVQTHEQRVIVPIGGGKDSAVSLELLKDSGLEVIPFLLNPNPAMVRIIHAARFDNSMALKVDRKLDPLLLDLNNKGYLNGHTPFSALLAFVIATSAAMTASRYIALSNESSANEATIPGTLINHQYSKSLHFESSFRQYLNTQLTPEIKYFSFLRPLNEVQIAWLFSRMPQYHNAFRSCNIGSKTDSWCGSCPKCLFTFTMMAPFVHRNQLIRIFGKDLFADPTLLELMKSLAGLTAEKPFECVGTVNEVQATIDYLNKYTQLLPSELPALLNDMIMPSKTLNQLLQHFNQNHYLPPIFETLLQERLND